MKNIPVFSVRIAAVIGLCAMLCIFLFGSIGHASASGNLVANGDFETASAGSPTTPASWTPDSWGTLTASFTYPVAGDASPSAAKVDVTNYSSGDAKWYMNHIPVTPGTVYQVSDNYLSTVPTEVDVEYLSSTGVYSYGVLASPASSNGAWASFSGTVTPPAGTVSMAILHLLQSNGSLTIDNVSVTSGSPPPPSPTISSFGANPTNIQTGQQSTLSWSVSNASSTRISGIGTVTGNSVNVSPTTTTTYVLTATNPQGSVTASASVTVTPPPPPPPPKPVINSFSSSPQTIIQGQSSTLSWSVTGSSTTLAIDQGVGTVTGTSKNVSPTATTTYTLTASNAGGTSTAQTTVNVTIPQTPPPPPAPTCNIGANPQQINAASSSLLSWTSQNATQASLDNGIGSVATSGSKSVSPTATTTYTLTVFNGGTGTSTCNTSVGVTQPPPPPPPQNLIVNGNLASGSANNPTGWNADYYGSLKATFAYPVAGISGGKAAQVTVANYKNGAADWDPNPVAVTPGVLYTFSDSYKATTNSEIDVQYIVQKAFNNPNECSPDSNPAYVDCYEVVTSSLPPTATFTTFSSAISPPAGAVSMTLLHLLHSNGTLTVTNFSLVQGVSASNAYTKGMVSLTFDDGYLDHYTNAFPILKNAPGGPMHGTFYMIPNVTTDPTQTGYMTISQMLEMQSAGNDMASHTADHCDLVALLNNPNSAKDGGKPSGNAGDPGIGCPDHALAAATTSQAEITNSKIELAGFGATPDDNLAYPFGSFNGVIEQQVKNAGFKAARTVDYGYNTRSTNPYALVVQHLDSSTSVATVESWIQTALANKVWLILVYHQIDSPQNANDIYNVTPQDLQTEVNYLGQNHVCVLTMTQVLNNVSCP